MLLPTKQFFVAYCLSAAQRPFGDDCPICHDAQEDPIRLPCPDTQVYCRHCIVTWFAQSTACPSCRTKLFYGPDDVTLDTYGIPDYSNVDAHWHRRVNYLAWFKSAHKAFPPTEQAAVDAVILGEQLQSQAEMDIPSEDPAVRTWAVLDENQREDYRMLVNNLYIVLYRMHGVQTTAAALVDAVRYQLDNAVSFPYYSPEVRTLFDEWRGNHVGAFGEKLRKRFNFLLSQTIMDAQDIARMNKETARLEELDVMLLTTNPFSLPPDYSLLSAEQRTRASTIFVALFSPRSNTNRASLPAIMWSDPVYVDVCILRFPLTATVAFRIRSFRELGDEPTIEKDLIMLANGLHKVLIRYEGTIMSYGEF